MTTLQWIPTLAGLQKIHMISYGLVVCSGKPSCALTLLAYWDAPWSPNAKRYAYHVLHTALAHGLEIL